MLVAGGEKRGERKQKSTFGTFFKGSIIIQEREVGGRCWWRKERREKAEIVFWNFVKGSIVQGNWNDKIQEVIMIQTLR